MVWKVLEALGMLSEALGSFDVNTVCPLPGSWINHLQGLLTTVWQFLWRVDVCMQIYGVF